MERTCHCPTCGATFRLVERDAQPELPLDYAVPEEVQGLDRFLKDTQFRSRAEGLVKAWRQAYPRVDIRRECAQAHAWLVAAPKHKQRYRVAPFLSRWMKKAGERGGTPHVLSLNQRQLDEELTAWLTQEYHGTHA